MKLRNQKGFFHILGYLLVFVIFGLTIYVCLDILNLIDVPEQYSLAQWLSGVRTVVPEEPIDQNTTRNIRIELENKTNLSENFVGNIPQINSYEPSEVNLNGYETPTEFSYYHQLDDYAKIIYQELEKNLEQMKSGTYNVQFGKTFDDLLQEEKGEEVLNESFQLAINALNFDHPDLFYLNVSKMYLLTKITTKLWKTSYEVEIGANQGQSYLNPSFSNQEEVDQAIATVEAEKQRIKARLKGSLENQIRTVHDYLIDKLEYDSTLSKDNIYNIYGALINRCTVCEGYARSFKYIMDDLKVPCIIACGTAVNSNGMAESHAWNYVRLNGKWYAIDVTWDDPVIIGNGYVSSSLKYKYYLKGSEEFFTNHTEDGNIVGNSNFKYPNLSTTDY